MKKWFFVLSFWAMAVSAEETAPESNHFSEVAASFFRKQAASIQEDPIPSCRPKCAHEEMCPGDFSSHLQGGGDYTHVRLSQKDSPPYNGNLGGGQLLYEFRTGRRIYGGVSVRWRQGKISGSLGHGTLYDGDVNERIGYTFGKNAYLFTLYTGFGFRYLEHKLQLKSSSHVRYQYEEFYVPVGFLYDCQFTDRFNWGLYGVWMPQVYPTVTIKPTGGARWIIKRTWRNGQLAMPFTFACNSTRSVTLMFKPFFEYWQDGKTIAKVVLGAPLGLPQNTYLFGGIDVNLSYSF